MRIRIVVANQVEAHFFDTLSRRQALIPAGGLGNPVAGLRDQDLESDRPGRVFNGAARAGHRRGATPRHAANGERSTRQHAIEAFARRIGAELGKSLAAHRFDRVVLVAEPRFLGRLRRALPAAVRAQVSASVAHDLVGKHDRDLRDYLPGDVYTGTAGFRPVRRAHT